MSHHQRRNAASGFSIETMHVTAADTACPDPHQHILGPDLRRGHLDHLELHIFFKQQRVHVNRIAQAWNNPDRPGV